MDTNTPLLTLSGVLDYIGRGYRLRIPHDGSAPTLRPSPMFEDLLGEEVGIDAYALGEALRSGQLHLMTEENEGSRVGWREAGMDGDRADWYCMVQ